MNGNEAVTMKFEVQFTKTAMLDALPHESDLNISAVINLEYNLTKKKRSHSIFFSVNTFIKIEKKMTKYPWNRT